MTVEYLQTRRLHDFSGQHVPLLSHPHSKEALPHVQNTKMMSASLFLNKAVLDLLAVQSAAGSMLQRGDAWEQGHQLSQAWGWSLPFC